MKDSINYFALVASAVVSYLLSYVWFMMLFRAPYITGLGRTKQQMDQGPNMLVASGMQLVGNVVMAFVLAWLMKQLGYQTVLDGIKLGVIVWLGFVAAVMGPMYAFQAFSLQFFFINAGSVLISLVIMGATLGRWG